MGKDNIRYKTGLTDVAETYVDVINSSSDISQIGTQIMGMNFLHEQAIAQNDAEALEVLREATPHFRTIVNGLESFVHSLETGKRTNTKDLTPLIDKNKPEELKTLPAPEGKTRVKRKYKRKTDKEDSLISPDGYLTVKQAMKIHPDLFPRRTIINSLVAHGIIGKSGDRRISKYEIEELRQTMEGKKYVMTAEIASKAGINEASLYTRMRKGLIDEYVERIVDSKGPGSVRVIEINREAELIERLKASKGKSLEKNVEEELNEKSETGEEERVYGVGKREYYSGRRSSEGVINVTEKNLERYVKTGYEIVSTDLRQDRQLRIHLKDIKDESETKKDIRQHFESILKRTGNSSLTSKFSYVVKDMSVFISYNTRGRPTKEITRVLKMYENLLVREVLRR